MGITEVKARLQTFLGTVSGIGTVDTAALDPDEIPRRLATQSKTSPYWALRVPGFADRQAQFGDEDRFTVFRPYTVELEGWRGFAGTADVTADWDTLVSRIANEIQALNITPSTLNLPGFYALLNLTVAQNKPVELGTSKSRAHHVLITFQLQVTETFTT